MSLLDLRAPLLDQAEWKQLQREQSEQSDFRIGEERFLWRRIDRFDQRQAALDPLTRRLRSALKLVHVAVHNARGNQQHRIVQRG